MAPDLEAGVFRELCLVLSVLLNIARPPYRFFHAAMQHSLGVGASLALFSNQGPAPLVRWWTRRKWREPSATECANCTPEFRRQRIRSRTRIGSDYIKETGHAISR